MNIVKDITSSSSLPNRLQVLETLSMRTLTRIQEFLSNKQLFPAVCHYAKAVQDSQGRGSSSKSASLLSDAPNECESLVSATPKGRESVMEPRLKKSRRNSGAFVV